MQFWKYQNKFFLRIENNYITWNSLESMLTWIDFVILYFLIRQVFSRGRDLYSQNIWEYDFCFDLCSSILILQIWMIHVGQCFRINNPTNHSKCYPYEIFAHLKSFVMVEWFGFCVIVAYNIDNLINISSKNIIYFCWSIKWCCWYWQKQ